MKIPLDGKHGKGKFFIIDDEDYEKVKQHKKWYLCNHGYPHTRVYEPVNTTLRLSRFIMNVYDDRVIDHINHDVLDNRKSNLRVCTMKENMMNKSKNRTSLYKGIKRQKTNWSARINFNKKSYHLGCFATAEEAARAYDKAALSFYGEYAHLNFPDFDYSNYIPMSTSQAKKKHRNIKVRFKKLVPHAIVPTRAKSGDAGFDCFAAYKSGLLPGQSGLVRTGIAIQLPSGYTAMVCPRSGLALNRNVTVLNGPGIIDEGYTSEVGIILINHDPFNTFKYDVGDRIAQIVIVKYEIPEFIEVAELDDTERGGNGFGSTGVSSRN